MTNSVPPSSEPPVETEAQAGQVRNGSEVSSPKTRKRPRAPSGDSLREFGHSKEDGSDREEEDSTPNLVTNRAARMSSDTAQEVIQEEATHQVRNGSECSSPKTSKRLRTSSGDSLRECDREAGRTHVRIKANVISPEKVGGDREEEDPKPSLVTSSAARIISDAVQEVVPEEATPVDYLPPGWTRQKLEPDW
jgi:hypothetical protein